LTDSENKAKVMESESPVSIASAHSQLSSLPKGVLLGQVRANPDERVPSGNTRFDQLVGGGFPRARLSEVVGSTSSGRTSLAYGLLASMTGRGEIGALVDCRDRFEPRSAEAAGVCLSRLLWVRPRDERGALRCCEILIGTAGLGIVVLDLADGLSPIAVARFGTAWGRLARLAAASRVTLVLLSRERLAGSSAALCVALHGGHPFWPKHALRLTLFGGIASRAEVMRLRGEAPPARSIELRS
jgi:RecA/RadA recombinase